MPQPSITREPLTSINGYWRGNQGGGLFACQRKSDEMEEPDIQIEEIQAEIRESIERAKALVAELERLVRDPVNEPPHL